MSDRRFDGIELIEWADKYGHPEEWAKKAQDLHAKNERLAGELAQVKAERDNWEAAWNAERIEVGRSQAERDTALRHVEAVLEWSNTERFAGRTRHEDDAPSAARAFLLSMRGRDE